MSERSEPTDPPIEILHIEDNAGDAQLVRQALATCQTLFQVTHVSTGEEALELLNRAANDSGPSRPDLILLDLDLPRISGHELLHNFYNDDRLKPIPVIVLSGLVYAESLLGEHESKIQGCFGKPESPDGYNDLARDIECVWLQQRQQPEE